MLTNVRLTLLSILVLAGATETRAGAVEWGVQRVERSRLRSRARGGREEAELGSQCG